MLLIVGLSDPKSRPLSDPWTRLPGHVQQPSHLLGPLTHSWILGLRWGDSMD